MSLLLSSCLLSLTYDIYACAMQFLTHLVTQFWATHNSVILTWIYWAVQYACLCLHPGIWEIWKMKKKICHEIHAQHFIKDVFDQWYSRIHVHYMIILINPLFVHAVRENIKGVGVTNSLTNLAFSRHAFFKKLNW